MSNHMAWKQRDQLKISIPEGVKNAGAYRNLMNQVNKIARHNRQGSFKTRDRYYEAVDRFARHLADSYNVQKFNNISGKHLASYIRQMQTKGLSVSTIKTDIAAIRFFHDKFENTRYILPDNKELNEKYGVELAQRKFGGVDRTWSEKEYRGMVSHAQSLGRMDIAHMLKLGRQQGLRLHETVRLDRAAVEQALRTGELTVKGKGGLVRDIPLHDSTRALFEKIIPEVNRGSKLFVPEGSKAHEVMKSVQTFIENHRCNYEESKRESHLTYHGLRHSFAREEYESRVAEGMDEKDARLEVAKLLGHGRDDVTNIYL